jgi:hypothetical protein
VPELDVEKPAAVGVIASGVAGGSDPVMARLESRYPDGRVVSGPDGHRYFIR